MAAGTTTAFRSSYHDVYDAANPPEGASSDQNLISTTLLDQQLSWLNENGYYFPSWAEARAYIEGGHSLPAKSVVLTFDDGSEGFLTYAIPLLENHKIPATSFVICSDSDIQDKLSNYASPYVDFQSHSYDLHRAGTSGKGHGGRIYDLTSDEVAGGPQQSADILKTSDAFAYPFGDVSDAAPAGVEQAGFLLAFTTQYGQVHPGDDPMQLKRMRVCSSTYRLGFECQAARSMRRRSARVPGAFKLHVSVSELTWRRVAGLRASQYRKGVSGAPSRRVASLGPAAPMGAGVSHG